MGAVGQYVARCTLRRGWLTAVWTLGVVMGAPIKPFSKPFFLNPKP